MIRAAADYARHAGVAPEKLRFDVVNVICSTPPAVTHFRGRFFRRNRGAFQLNAP